MRSVFDALFAAAGASFDTYVRLQPAVVLARHAWPDGAQLDLFADPARSAAAIGAFAGAAEARRFLAFCERARRVYQTLDATFIRAARPNPIELTHRVGLARLGDLWRISPFATLWRALGEYFHDPRLRQLFGRYATYCGSSPFLAPATLMLVAHVEQDGVWLVEGGMHRLAVALAALAGSRGAQLRFGVPVERVLLEAGRAAGVQLSGGERIDADAVVFNGDVAALGAGLLGIEAMGAVPPVPADARSLSALTWTMTAQAQGFALSRHNVFFCADYAAEFRDVFEHGRLPQEPTVYICAQDRGAAGDAPASTPFSGGERLLMLVNAPASGDRHAFDAAEVDACEQRTHALLARCGLHLHGTEPATRTTPADFNRRFPGTGGALYGQASHGWRASFSRPGARSAIPRLYLAGGSVHPGPGVPMAALSGRQAAASVLADLGRR
jgi:1-hydroxycarotenoid 3,4-desaturase